MLKRYWLFVFEDHYPKGGMNDFVYSYDSIKEAKERFYKSETLSSDIYGHIFDSDENIIVTPVLEMECT